MIRFQRRNFGPYNSLKKKIFDVTILFADEIFYFPRKSSVELEPNPERTQLSPAYLCDTTGISGNTKNIGDDTENPLVDLRISLEKKFASLDLYVLGNVF